MLTYLDSLCEAMAARDLPRLRHLLEDHPLVRLLPADALREARRFLTQHPGRHAVPLATLQFRDQTARLLGERPEHQAPPALDESPRRKPPRAAAAARRRRTTLQTELPLSV
jgi:hypothetical protein